MAEEFISLGKASSKNRQKPILYAGISASSGKKVWDPEKPERDARTLHVSFKKIKTIPDREIIRRLHRNIVDVKFPRQKSAKFCYAVFDSEVEAEEAKRDLENLKGPYTILVNRVGTKRQYVPGTNKSSTESGTESCRLLVTGYPEFAAEVLLKAAFPKLKSIVFPTAHGLRQKHAFVEFESPELTQEALTNSKSLSVNGVPLIVKPAPLTDQNPTQESSKTMKRKRNRTSHSLESKKNRTG